MTNEDLGFTLHRRGSHPLAGRTILQVAPALADAEADRPVLEIAAALADAGARSLVAAPMGRLVSELQAKGGIWIDFPAAARNPLTMALAARQLRRMIEREQVDLVHARSRRGAWISFAATRRGTVPLVTNIGQLALTQSIVKQRYGSVLAKGDRVIAASDFAAATAASIYPEVAGRITLVRTGVELGPFTASAVAASRVQAVRQAWAVAPEERVILLVAEPSIWKGHKVLIEAVRQLLDTGVRDLKLVFIGDAKGAFGREIELAVRAADMKKRVHRVEECADMPAALLAAAVVVVPSMQAELFGRIAVEAQGVGTPVVVSDLGALPETVLAPPDVEASRRTGWRVSPSDPVLLAEALDEALSLGASGRDALGLRARRHVEQRFSLGRMARETLEIYSAVLERQAALN